MTPTDRLVRYLLDDLPPADRAEVAAAVAADPATADRLAALRRVADGLSAADDGPAPPPGLVTATLARTAEYLVAHGLFRPPPPSQDVKPRAGRAAAAVRRLVADPVFGGGRAVDAAVAFTAGLLAVGLCLGAVGRLREEGRVRACQYRLHGVHAALAGYGDVHGGRYPRVGDPGLPTADAFAAELVRTGHLPAAAAADCPAAAADGRPDAGYAYTLGYRTPVGLLVGVTVGGDGHTPGPAVVAADAPAGDAVGPHRHGLNVLTAGGSVRLAAGPAVGYPGRDGPRVDHIFHNELGQRRAGLHLWDVALGAAGDVP